MGLYECRPPGNECEVACRGYQKKIPVVFQPVRTIDRGVGGGEMMTGGRGPIIGLHAPLESKLRCKSVAASPSIGACSCTHRPEIGSVRTTPAVPSKQRACWSLVAIANPDPRTGCILFRLARKQMHGAHVQACNRILCDMTCALARCCFDP